MTAMLEGVRKFGWNRFCPDDLEEIDRHNFIILLISIRSNDDALCACIQFGYFGLVSLKSFWKDQTNL